MRRHPLNTETDVCKDNDDGCGSNAEKEVRGSRVCHGGSFDVRRVEKRVRRPSGAWKDTQTRVHSIKSIDDTEALMRQEEQPFIQALTVANGQLPSVTAYFPDSVKDMQRFCDKRHSRPSSGSIGFSNSGLAS